jgi:hypothetical protein
MNSNGDIPGQESYVDRAIRKCQNEPLVPIGALVTVGFLLQGLKAFHRGQTATAQKLMRGRVAAQAFTVIAMAFGTFMGFRPADRPKTMEEVMERKSTENGN